MKSPADVIEEAVAQTGWSTGSQLAVALDYIANQQSDDAFADYVAERVAEELDASLPEDELPCP
jgi:hypothetical protein